MDIGMTLLGQALTFALLIAFTAKFIWPPLMAAIEERQQKIAEGLAAADRSKKDLAQAERRSTRSFARRASRRPRSSRRPEARRAQIIDHAKEEAIEEGNRQKAAAAAEIVSSGNRAREDLRKQVSALAVGRRREADPARNRQQRPQGAAGRTRGTDLSPTP
jgi:F-type H+-transporting ATPase subunit b